MNLIGEKIKSEPLKELVHDMHQGINTVTEKVEYLKDGIPIIQSKHITKGHLHFDNVKYLSSEAYEKYHLKYQPQVDDLLVCNIGTIGKSLRISEENQFLIAWNLFLIKIKKDHLNSSFFAHYLYYLADHKYFDRFLTGGTVKFINKKTMGNIPVPLPPLDQQKKIAAILDAADDYRQKTKALIAKYDELTQSLFLDMFGDPVVNPKGWDKDDFKNSLTDIKNGITRRPKTEADKTGDMVLKLKHIRSNLINYGCENRILLDIKEKEKFNVRIGDLLFIRVNGNPDYVGRCALHSNINQEVFYNDHIMRVRYDVTKYNGVFLSMYLNYPSGQSEIKKRIKTSAGQHTINQGGLELLNLILPPVKFQNQFAQRVQAIEAQKAQAQASLQKAEDLFNSLLQRAFKGELV